MRQSVKLVGLAACLAWYPCSLHAQNSTFGDGTLEGVVRDTSGSALPGVTVDASSPSLIEKSRTTVTSDTGRYQFSGLPPGTYRVTFTLEGFNTQEREKVTVEGSRVVDVPAEMTIGTKDETVTVTAEQPGVDVRNTAQQMVFPQDLVDTLGRRFPNTLAALFPEITCDTRDVGQITFEFNRTCRVHGGRAGDQRIAMDGVNLGAIQSPELSAFLPNTEAAEEIVIETGASGAESQTGGIKVNLIPRAGGNTLRGSLFVTAGFGRMQGRNLTQRLVDQGFAVPDTLEKTMDFNPWIGGPIVRDKLWFSGAMRRHIAQIRTDQYHNVNAFDNNNWKYVGDPNRQARSHDGRITDYSLRTTWLVNASHTVAGMFSDQKRCECVAGISATRTPEAGFNDHNPVQRAMQLALRSSLSSRLWVEVIGQKRDIELHIAPLTAETSGVSPDVFQFYPHLIGATINNGAGILPNNFHYHGSGFVVQDTSSGGPFSIAKRPASAYNASIRFATGAHTFKAGLQDTFGYHAVTRYSITNPSIRYTFSEPYTPQSVTVYTGTSFTRNDLNHDMGMYVQDRWTMNRLTLHGVLRYDWLKSSYPEQTIPETRYGRPAATFSRGTNVDWKDVSPRIGLAYDVMGNGKTALKFTLNKHVVSQGLSGIAVSGNPTAPGRAIVNNFTRNWNDTDGDKVADCDLYDIDRNGECTNAISNQIMNTAPTVLTDGAARYGWGIRPYNWEMSLRVERELWPGASVDAAYYRRWFGNFLATDDTACVDSVAGTGCRGAFHYKSYDIAAPVDSRLPGGGGYMLPGFIEYDCSGPSANCGGATAADIARLTPVNQVVRVADIGAKQVERWDGIDASLRIRRDGLFLMAGASTGRRYTNECEVWQLVPEMQGLGRPFAWCETTEPFRTTFKGTAAYTLPRFDALPDWFGAAIQDVQLVGIVQSIPGNEMSANYNMTNTEFARLCPSQLPDRSCSTLGTFLANQTQPGNTRNVNLLLPATRYDERHHQVDVRIGKLVRIGRTRAMVTLEVFNLLNANPVLARNNTLGQATTPGAYAAAQQQQADGGYNSLWLPIDVLLPRVAKFSFTFDF